MIHGIYGNTVYSYLSLEESRLDTSVDKSQIRYLFKLTNDLTKTVKYAYGIKSTHNDRYVINTFTHNTTENLYTGAIDLKPFGYWSYEVYEVSWIDPDVLGLTGSNGLEVDTAPTTETEILSPAAATKGVVQEKVHEGKLYVTETAGSEQIQYTTHTESSATNYLYTD